jgi:hypothetical protein
MYPVAKSPIAMTIAMAIPINIVLAREDFTPD